MSENSGSKSPKNNNDEILKELLNVRDKFRTVAENLDDKHFSRSRKEICEGIDSILITVCQTLMKNNPDRLDVEESNDFVTVGSLVNNVSKDKMENKTNHIEEI